ncbi:MAG TPA: hypothetical protein VKS20_11030 [Candidatus Acidoferrales bacterium]|nr:hypothetical protein [Candidatus Acidoferrales bacterium]
MCAKAHCIVPRGFSFAGERPSREALAKFRHVTGAEARGLRLAGRIEKVGPKLWQLTEAFATAIAGKTADGLLSREICGAVRYVMVFEMARRPAPNPDEWLAGVAVSRISALGPPER